MKWTSIYENSASQGQKTSTLAGNNVLKKFYIKDVLFWVCRGVNAYVINHFIFEDWDFLPF